MKASAVKDLSVEDMLANYKLVELREFCRELDIMVTGNKVPVAERLYNYFRAPKLASIEPTFSSLQHTKNELHVLQPQVPDMTIAGINQHYESPPMSLLTMLRPEEQQAISCFNQFVRLQHQVLTMQVTGQLVPPQLHAFYLQLSEEFYQFCLQLPELMANLQQQFQQFQLMNANQMMDGTLPVPNGTPVEINTFEDTTPMTVQSENDPIIIQDTVSIEKESLDLSVSQWTDDSVIISSKDIQIDVQGASPVKSSKRSRDDFESQLAAIIKTPVDTRYCKRAKLCVSDREELLTKYNRDEVDESILVGYEDIASCYEPQEDTFYSPISSFLQRGELEREKKATSYLNAQEGYIKECVEAHQKLLEFAIEEHQESDLEKARIDLNHAIRIAITLASYTRWGLTMLMDTKTKNTVPYNKYAEWTLYIMRHCWDKRMLQIICATGGMKQFSEMCLDSVTLDSCIIAFRRMCMALIPTSSQEKKILEQFAAFRSLIHDVTKELMDNDKWDDVWRWYSGDIQIEYVNKIDENNKFEEFLIHMLKIDKRPNQCFSLLVRHLAKDPTNWNANQIDSLNSLVPLLEDKKAAMTELFSHGCEVVKHCNGSKEFGIVFKWLSHCDFSHTILVCTLQTLEYAIADSQRIAKINRNNSDKWNEYCLLMDLVTKNFNNILADVVNFALELIPESQRSIIKLLDCLTWTLISEAIIDLKNGHTTFRVSNRNRYEFSIPDQLPVPNVTELQTRYQCILKAVYILPQTRVNQGVLTPQLQEARSHFVDKDGRSTLLNLWTKFESLISKQTVSDVSNL
jgi:hypothetical protein